MQGLVLSSSGGADFLTGCLFGAEHRNRIGPIRADLSWQRSKERDSEKPICR